MARPGRLAGDQTENGVPPRISAEWPPRTVLQPARTASMRRVSIAQPIGVPDEQACCRSDMGGMSLRAFENQECLFSRTWTVEIPRDGVWLPPCAVSRRGAEPCEDG